MVPRISEEEAREEGAALVYADITIDQLLMSATKPYFTCALFHLFIFNIKFEIEFTLRLPFCLV